MSPAIRGMRTGLSASAPPAAVSVVVRLEADEAWARYLGTALFALCLCVGLYVFAAKRVSILVVTFSNCY